MIHSCGDSVIVVTVPNGFTTLPTVTYNERGTYVDDDDDDDGDEDEGDLDDGMPLRERKAIGKVLNCCLICIL